jgi:type I restriction enzyme M protein
MIDCQSFRAKLSILGFTQDDASVASVMHKSFSISSIDFELKVDFTNEKILYPVGHGFKIHQAQTCNFSSSENAVVFECVNRLFEKGYKPEHIELEPEWKLGHGGKSGRADILVRNQQGNALLIIECKTAGREFDKAWKDTLTDGAHYSATLSKKKLPSLCVCTRANSIPRLKVL